MQHQWRKWLFEVGYSHNKTYDISWGWNENEPSFGLWKQLQAPVFDSTGRPVDILPWNVQVPNPFYNLPGITGGSIGSTKTVALNQLLNPDPLLGTVTENNPTGKNQYDAGLGKVEHRFTNSFSIIGAFTWSKLFEDTAFLGPQIAGAVIEHKLGGEDRPFHLNVAPIWDIPVGRGKRFGGGMSRWFDADCGRLGAGRELRRAVRRAGRILQSGFLQRPEFRGITTDSSRLLNGRFRDFKFYLRCPLPEKAIGSIIRQTSFLDPLIGGLVGWLPPTAPSLGMPKIIVAENNGIVRALRRRQRGKWVLFRCVATRFQKESMRSSSRWEIYAHFLF